LNCSGAQARAVAIIGQGVWDVVLTADDTNCRAAVELQLDAD
jgi:hypothetical protein